MSKGKEEWIDKWQFTKNKSLKKDEYIIHYSDLSHLRSILSWIKPQINNKLKDVSKRENVTKLLNKIVEDLENYISQERQESFHSRLQLYDANNLNNFLVDTRRILEKINKLKGLIGW